MPSARSVITPGAKPGQRFRRQGKPSEAEKALVAQVVQDQPTTITPSQINGLAKALNRTPAVIKQLVAEARENFVAAAGDYVAIHKQAAQLALANGDAKSLDVAVKASQWAIQSISADGQRVVERTTSEPTGQKIFIGINVGGVSAPQAVVTEVVDAA